MFARGRQEEANQGMPDEPNNRHEQVSESLSLALGFCVGQGGGLQLKGPKIRGILETTWFVGSSCLRGLLGLQGQT